MTAGEKVDLVHEDFRKVGTELGGSK